MDFKRLSCLSEVGPVTAFDGASLFGFAAALGGGLLVGTERERRYGRTDQEQSIGVRTCVLTALAGAVAASLSTGAVVAGGIAVGAFAVTSYWTSRLVDPGLTSELSLLATYLLAALAMSHPRLAAALFVVQTITLASKEPLHRFSRQILNEHELNDGLLLAASALIVLPMLPDRTIDPLHALNLRKLWLLVLWVMAINTIGYIGLRVTGTGNGLALAGFFGGFVSSTATIGGMAQRARANPGLTRTCASAGLVSNVATLIQLALIFAVVSPQMLIRVFGLPLLGAAIVAIVVGVTALYRAGGSEPVDANLLSSRPFVFSHAVLFALLVAMTLMLSAALSRWAGSRGTYAAAAASGLADVHAASIAIGQLAQSHVIREHAALRAVVLAFTANSLLKCVSAASGGRAYFRQVAAGTVLVNATLAVSLLFHMGG
jgi:uncharacterized membrane protein (DUF4010 family)